MCQPRNVSTEGPIAQDSIAKDFVAEGTIVDARELLWEQENRVRGNCVEDCKSRREGVEDVYRRIKCRR